MSERVSDARISEATSIDLGREALVSQRARAMERKDAIAKRQAQMENRLIAAHPEEVLRLERIQIFRMLH